MDEEEYSRELKAVHLAQDALSLMDEGDEIGAMELFERSLQYDGELDESLGALGALRFLKGELGEARELLLRARSVNGGNVDALVILPLIESPPGDHTSALMNAGMEYINFMQFPRAYLFFREVWRLKPDESRALSAMAFVSREMGLLDRSVKEYRELLNISPGSWDVMFDLSVVLIKRGELEEAEKLLLRAAELAPGVPQIWNNLGFIKEVRGELEEARRLYERALKLDENYYPSLYSIGRILQKEGKMEEAMEYLERGLEIKSIFQLEDVESAERRKAQGGLHAKEVVTRPPDKWGDEEKEEKEG